LHQIPSDGLGDPVSMSGEVLLKIAAGNYVDKDCLKVAKNMARANLDQLLGGKPLQSRNLFQPIVNK
jgi:recombinational DNA repair protein (RecF pathway)